MKWPWQTQSNLCISINQTHLTCCLFSSNTKTLPLPIINHTVIPLTDRTYCNGMLINPSAIIDQIHTQISDIPKQTRLRLALNAPVMRDYVISTTSAQPSPHQLRIMPQRHTLWHYSYLGPHDDGRFLFYVYGIWQPYMFQWQLLAQRLQMPLDMVISGRSALLALYHHVYGTAFRHAQLSTHMMQKNNCIEHIFSNEIRNRIAYVPPRMRNKNGPISDEFLHTCGLLVA